MLADLLIENAIKYLGKPYVWGGESDDEGGYDCSGFIYRVLNDSGINVSRLTAQSYYNKYRLNQVDTNTKGALLFFGTGRTKINHVALSDGAGYMYESIGSKSNTKSNPGKGVVKSKITRRSDLIYAATPFEPIIERPKLATYTLKISSKGNNVRYLQEDLNYTIDARLICDGIFGPKTLKALKDFQSKFALKIDGIYGPKSYSKMKGELI